MLLYHFINVQERTLFCETVTVKIIPETGSQLYCGKMFAEGSFVLLGGNDWK